MDPVPVPSTPDPTWTALVAALIRAILQVLAGFGITFGVINDSNVSILAGAVVMVGTLVWSMWQKYQAAKKAHASAQVSANAGQPLLVR